MQQWAEGLCFLGPHVSIRIHKDLNANCTMNDVEEHPKALQTEHSQDLLDLARTAKVLLVYYILYIGSV